MWKRRKVLKAAGLGMMAGLAPRVVLASDTLPEGVHSSDLIYLTPIKSNGEESSCQSEIWFVTDGTDLFVCTGTESWRAQAPRKGLTRTRIWVGDLGNWRGTDGKYKRLPQLEATAGIVDDKAQQDEILDLFGDKYPVSWVVYGPRFRSGLEDGSRTMIRYRPA
ncbi:MAG: hypothetical protein HUJ31_16525 [Pseudomonadales bacterium]|nr:hypothetical protein [Pseudomonadales bacterium]